jgi:protein-tyrosine-phosphatase
MGWEAIISIVAQYGLPLAESLFQKWSAGAPPTQADFTALTALASQNATAQAMAVLKQQGIDPTSAQGQAILALVK